MGVRYVEYLVDKPETQKAAMLRAFGPIALTLTLLLGVQASASAQSVCTTHPEMAKQLKSRYSEAPVAIGLAVNAGVIEVFSTGDGATWTMVLTLPDGMSCVMATGEAWEHLTWTVLDPQA